MDLFPHLLTVHPYLLDHRIQSGAVLPAVHAMQILASITEERFPDISSRTLTLASFGKLLPLPVTTPSIETFIGIEPLKAHGIRTSLFTKTRSKSGIVRNLQHATMVFSAEADNEQLPISPPDTKCIQQIPISCVYPELIPFGKCFQNLAAPIKIYAEGATTSVFGGISAPSPTPLGSSFPLDAAFQAACAWGKKHTNRICFPIALKKRKLYRPTLPGLSYKVIIRFKEESNAVLEFDLMLTDDTNAPCEIVAGLQMKAL